MRKFDRYERAHGMLLNLAESARSKRLGGHKKKAPEGTPSDGAPGDGDDPELGDALEAFGREDCPPTTPTKKKGRPF